MKITRLTWELFVFNIFMLSIFCVGLFYNLTQKIYANDVSFMTIVISVLLGLAVILSTYISLKGKYIDKLLFTLSFLSVKVYLYLGLSGTIIGLYSYLVSGNNTSLVAMSTVFFATLTGLIARVWTECMIFIFRRNAEEERV